LKFLDLQCSQSDRLLTQRMKFAMLLTLPLYHAAYPTSQNVLCWFISKSVQCLHTYCLELAFSLPWTSQTSQHF